MTAVAHNRGRDGRAGNPTQPAARSEADAPRARHRPKAAVAEASHASVNAHTYSRNDTRIATQIASTKIQ
jgi:hypothetical protein